MTTDPPRRVTIGSPGNPEFGASTIPSSHLAKVFATAPFSGPDWERCTAAFLGQPGHQAQFGNTWNRAPASKFLALYAGAESDFPRDSRDHPGEMEFHRRLIELGDTVLHMLLTMGEGVTWVIYLNADLTEVLTFYGRVLGGYHDAGDGHGPQVVHDPEAIRRSRLQVAALIDAAPFSGDAWERCVEAFRNSPDEMGLAGLKGRMPATRVIGHHSLDPEFPRDDAEHFPNEVAFAATMHDLDVTPIYLFTIAAKPMIWNVILNETLDAVITFQGRLVEGEFPDYIGPESILF